MVNSSLEVILLAVGIDSVLFFAIILSFSVIKNLRNRTVVPPSGETWPVSTFAETEFPLHELVKKVYNVDREDFLTFCKAEGRLYLDFVRHVAYLFAGMTVLGCGLLLPLYMTRENRLVEKTEVTGISNVSKTDHPSLAICFSALLCFSLIYYYFAYYNYRVYKEAQVSSLFAVSSIQDCTIMVTNIPYGLRPELYNQAFFQVFDNLLPGEVLDAFILPDYEQVHEEYKELERIRGKIAHYVAYEQVVEISTQKVDALNYYQEQEHRSIHRIQSHKLAGQAINCGYGFVVCSETFSAQNLIKTFHASVKDYKNMDCASWKLEPAPAPKDILWENMGGSPVITLCKKVVLTCAFVMLFFIILSPPAFLALISDILDYVGMSGTVALLVTEYLPSLMLFLYQRVIIPEVIKCIANRERHLTNSAVMKSRLEKYLLFNTMFIFILPFLGLQFLDFALMFVNEGFGDWNKHFALRLAETGQFFAVFLVHQTFLANGFDLLQPFRIVRVRWNLCGKVSEKEKMKAYVPDRFNFGYHYAMSLSALMIVITFSIAFPLILPIGLLYFLIKVRFTQFFVHKYNMLCFYYIDQVTAGEIGSYALTYLLIFIIFFQAVTAGLIMLDGSKLLIISGAVFLGVSLVVFVVFLFLRDRIWEYSMGRGGKMEPEMGVLKRETIEYKHVVDRDDSWERPRVLLQ